MVVQRRFERDLVTGDGVVLRDAWPEDVPAIRAFGETYVAAHYTPLIGAEAAHGQVRHWWNDEVLTAAVEAGRVVVADVSTGGRGELVAVAQFAHAGSDVTVYKLYVHPERRGGGLGRRLLDAVAERAPAGTQRLCVEHFAGNRRAGDFYEREGFTVERVEPSPTDDPRLAVVWRARPLAREHR